MSPSCRCHPPVRSSTQPRTSGSICDRPISPTVCSRPTPTSSTPAKTPGENFSPKPGASPRSRLATGPSSVSSSEGWYNNSKIEAFGLFTGQIGYAWNNVLWYVKGGAAVTDDAYRGTVSPTFPLADTLFDDLRETRWGGVVGTGVE